MVAIGPAQPVAGVMVAADPIQFLTRAGVVVATGPTQLLADAAVMVTVGPANPGLGVQFRTVIEI